MRMLIVEDDPDGRDNLAELFRRHDWRVVAVATTDAALSELRKKTVDLVLSDEELAYRSGSEMLRAAALEGLLSDVCVLMYTSRAELLDVPTGVRVLRKPLGIALLVEEVAAALAAGPGRATSCAPGGRSSASPRAQARVEPRDRRGDRAAARR